MCIRDRQIAPRPCEACSSTTSRPCTPTNPCTPGRCHRSLSIRPVLYAADRALGGSCCLLKRPVPGADDVHLPLPAEDAHRTGIQQDLGAEAQLLPQEHLSLIHI